MKIILNLIAAQMQECLWQEGWFGKGLQCPPNYIAHGLCGSGMFADCGRAVVYNKLKCCRISATITPQCVPKGSFYPGMSIECPTGTAVTASCGSGSKSDCPAGRFGKMPYWFSCCGISKDHVVTSECTWSYAQFGESVECRRDQVMAGMCGSLQNPKCPWRSSHGIRCCKFKRNH